MIFRLETVIGWQRAGFRLFWRWKSRRRIGPPGTDRELIELIRRKCAVNPTWGSPRIRDELAKLGLHASTTTLRRYRPKSKGHGSQSWRTFLQNHTGAIAAMDFFVVPTATFRLLYVLVVIRRECVDRVIVFDEQQLRQILKCYFPYYVKVRPYRSLDHDSPVPQAVQGLDFGKVIEMPLVGGLPHHYLRRAV